MNIKRIIFVLGFFLILISCRNESIVDSKDLVSNSKSSEQNFLLLKDVEPLRKFVFASKKLMKSTKENLNDSLKVLEIKTEVRNSYNALISSSENSNFTIFVYSLNKKNNKESYFLVEYLPKYKDKNNGLDNFTGITNYKTSTGAIFKTVYWDSGKIINNNANSSMRMDCHWESEIVTVMCSAGLHYPYDKECTAEVKGFFSISYKYICDYQSLDNNDGGGDIGDPRGGGANHTSTPCEKTKNILQNQTIADKVLTLKDKSKVGGEQAFKIKSDGTTSEMIDGGKHHVVLGDKTGYQGAYHNHTPTGITMFSPHDIVQLLGFARAQPTGGDEHKNAYFGFVGSEYCFTCTGSYLNYHYIIRFNGTYDDATKTYLQDKIDELEEDFKEKYQKLTNPDGPYGNKYLNATNFHITSEGLEILFFQTLNKMGLQEKVTLQKIDENGNVSNVTLNSNGTDTITTACL